MEQALNQVNRDEFMAMLEKLRQDRQSAIDSVGDISDGVVLRHRQSERWAFLLPDATESGRWRAQYFDSDGFSGHCTRDTEMEVIKEAVGQGFVIRDQCALDRIQNSKRFQRGNFVSNLLFQLSTGKITRESGESRLKEYDELNGDRNSCG